MHMSVVLVRPMRVRMHHFFMIMAMRVPQTVRDVWKNMFMVPIIMFVPVVMNSLFMGMAMLMPFKKQES